MKQKESKPLFIVHWSHPLSYSLSAFRDFFRSANFSLLICLSPAFTADAIGLFNSIPAFCKCWIIISVSRFRFTTSPTLRTLLLFGIFHCPVSCPPSLSVLYWARREVKICLFKRLSHVNVAAFPGSSFKMGSTHTLVRSAKRLWPKRHTQNLRKSCATLETGIPKFLKMHGAQTNRKWGLYR